MDLTGYETAMGAVLGSSVDALSWHEDVLDAGLRAALAEYNQAAPLVETVLDLTKAGHVQDLGTIADLRRVAAVAWPWDADGQSSETPAVWVRWVAVDGSPTAGSYFIRLFDVAPAAGEHLLVRYWRRFTVEGLDGADATNVPGQDEYLLSQGAAGHACTVRLRQLSEQPGVPLEAYAELGKVRDGLLAGFAAGLSALTIGGREGGVNWGNIGL